MPEQGSQHNTVTQPMRPAEVSREECEAILNPALPTSAEVVERLARAHLELLPEADELRSQIAALESQLQRSGKICSVCFTASWEPTEEGERCGYCWVQEQYKSLESQLADSQARIDALESEMNPHDIQRVDSQLRAAGALRAKPEAD